MSSFNQQFNDDDSIEENVPTMRSVAMMAPPMPLARAPIRAALKTATPVASSSSSSSSWNVTQPLKLPSWHPLSRSHTLVRGVPAEEISRRVADFLFAKSIAVEFNNKEAVAKAETSCCVKFCVRLWSKPNGVVVELQRSSGCGFVFQQVVKGIFAAVKKGSPSSLAARSLPAARPMPRCLPQIPPEEHEENVLSGVQVACDAICEGARFDACLLATQSLVQLTGDAICKVACAKKVLCPSSALLPKLLKLIIKQDTEGNDELERDHNEAMHRNATVILANCLEGIPASELSTVLSSLEDRTEILDALYADVSAAATKPHEAAAACRCLAVLVKVMPLDASLSSHVLEASHCRHALLREHCHKLLDGL